MTTVPLLSKRKRCNTHKTLSHFLIASLITHNSSAATLSSRKLQYGYDSANITTPTFGGCITLENDQIYCSIDPESNCPSDTTEPLFPHQIDLDKCDSPIHVEIGRCTNAGKPGSCSAFASSCPDPTQYLKKDATCSLVEDKSPGPDLLTHYPYCRTSAENDPTRPFRCVLSKEDCITGKEEFYNFEDAKNYPRCFCDSTPIGMCSINNEDNDEKLTEDNTICAVASDHCPDEKPMFTSAYDLTDMPEPPRECRLCQYSDISKYDLHENVVKSGRCKDGEAFGKCALESTECTPSEETFAGSYSLDDGEHMGCHADIFHGGDCSVDLEPEICTNYEGACGDPTKFAERSTCKLFEDSLNEEPMYFGRCKSNTSEDSRCVWNERECDEGEEWLAASKPSDWYDGCKCEDVETGACVDPTNSNTKYCAVSADGCADSHNYTSSSNTKSLGITCHLCQRSRINTIGSESPTAVVSNKPSEPPETFSPTESPTLRPTVTNAPSLSVLPTKAPITAAPSLPLPTETPTSAPTTNEPSPTILTFTDSPITEPTFAPTRSDFTFSPTPTEDNVDYDDDNDDIDDYYYADDFNDDYDEPGWKRKFDIALILSGSIGGTIVFTCIGVLFYLRNPLPVKLYRMNDDDGGLV